MLANQYYCSCGWRTRDCWGRQGPPQWQPVVSGSATVATVVILAKALCRTALTRPLCNEIARYRRKVRLEFSKELTWMTSPSYSQQAAVSLKRSHYIVSALLSSFRWVLSVPAVLVTPRGSTRSETRCKSRTAQSQFSIALAVETASQAARTHAIEPQNFEAE